MGTEPLFTRLAMHSSSSSGLRERMNERLIQIV
jgi:hypothetical protein